MYCTTESHQLQQKLIFKNLIWEKKAIYRACKYVTRLLEMVDPDMVCAGDVYTQLQRFASTFLDPKSIHSAYVMQH